MTRIFSGIQPTGRKHLGNYLGAIRQFVTGQTEGDSVISIVDLHATSVHYEPKDLRRYLYDTTALLLASGLDPDKGIFYRQGDVSEHSELCWLLCSVTAHGELNRMTQFKDKSAKQDLISAALFLYPVLQAADILLYDTNVVPVGDDQRQHVELTRVIAERFNQRFGKTFVVPEHRIAPVAARIMDLASPDVKMSTSAQALNGVVLVLDDEAATMKKFKSAVTDSGSEIKRGDDKAGISNLIEILGAVQNKTPAQIEAEWEGKRYGEFKVACGEAVNAYLAPVRTRYTELRADEAQLEAILAKGAQKARVIASKTMARVRERMAVGPVVKGNA
jgi:tryptophanyl-tRNA synthetase